MMVVTQAETHGKLILTQVFTHVWFGDWDHYEATFKQIPPDLANSLPFHPFYVREKTSFWYDNYFLVPGNYFIPPYVSTYSDQTEEGQHKARQDLLCLVGAFEKVGFYYPLEKDEFPDHIGSVTAFIAALLKEEIKAQEQTDEKLVNSLKNLQKEVYVDYLQIALENIRKLHQDKLEDPFFTRFLPYYIESMEELIN